jgi:hypothetical protein
LRPSLSSKVPSLEKLQSFKFDLANRPIYSLAMLELQIVTALFFRYFEVQLDPHMKAEDMEMKIAFSGSPVGEKVLLSLQRDNNTS